MCCSEFINESCLPTMVKLHFNESSMRYLAQHRPPDREGRLLYRKSKDSYKVRWFRLCGNLLFYFRTNEFGAIANAADPVGVLVLVQCQAQMEDFGDRPFVFSLVFDGEDGVKHFFCGQSEQCCEEWVSAIHFFSPLSLRLHMETLRKQIQVITGRDPKVDSVSKQQQLTISSPTNHETSVSSVDQVSSSKGHVGFTSYIERPAIKQAAGSTLPMSRADCLVADGVMHLTPKSNSGVAATLPKTGKSATMDIEVLPATKLSLQSWEKFN